MAAYNFIDLAGQSFERLTVIARGPNKGTSAQWICDCACGTKGILVLGGNLRRRNTESCGCLQKERAAKHLYKHGMANTSEHTIWMSMRQRCLNPQNQAYARYGGRGISVCDSWAASFDTFFTDMGLRPSPQHSLERRDNDGPYSPDNCYWATAAEQGRNTRRNRWLTFNNKTQCVTDWAQELGFPSNLIFLRLRRGWTVEETLMTPMSIPGKHIRHISSSEVRAVESPAA